MERIRGSGKAEKVSLVDLSNPTDPPKCDDLWMLEDGGESGDTPGTQELFKHTSIPSINLEKKPTCGAAKAKKRAHRIGPPKVDMSSSLSRMMSEGTVTFYEDKIGGPSRIFYDGDKTANLPETPYDNELMGLAAKFAKIEPDEAEHFGMVIASYIRRCPPRRREEMHVALLKTAGQFVSHSHD